MIKPIFNKAEISDIDHLASFANRFMALLPNDGSMVDVQPLIHRLVSQRLLSIGLENVGRGQTDLYKVSGRQHGLYFRKAFRFPRA